MTSFQSRTPWAGEKLRASWSPIKKLSDHLRRKRTPQATARAENPYSTHIPVLAGLAQLLRVHRVIELGAGHYSTPTFLDRRVFPDLKILHSFENDLRWGRRVRREVGHDPRHRLTILQHAMGSVTDQLQLAAYDLLLIDDSTSLAQRVDTIRAAGARCGNALVVVVHDFEQPEYQVAASEHLTDLKRCIVFKGFNPHTGIFLNCGQRTYRELGDLCRRITRLSSELEPDDAARWAQELAR